MAQQDVTLGRQLVAEAVGTALLLVAVVGSGIMAERLSGGNAGLALLANAVATGGALVALILRSARYRARTKPCRLVGAGEPRTTALARGPGLHTGPSDRCGCRGLDRAYHVRAADPASFDPCARDYWEWVGEFVATFGLLGLILSTSRHSPAAIPYAVAAYITGAYWFTSSTSFANPAVTFARSLTNTFAGIQLGHVPAFVVAEVIGGVAATLLFGWLSPDRARSSY